MGTDEIGKYVPVFCSINSSRKIRISVLYTQRMGTHLAGLESSAFVGAGAVDMAAGASVAERPRGNGCEA